MSNAVGAANFVVACNAAAANVVVAACNASASSSSAAASSAYIYIYIYIIYMHAFMQKKLVDLLEKMVEQFDTNAGWLQVIDSPYGDYRNRSVYEGFRRNDGSYLERGGGFRSQVTVLNDTGENVTVRLGKELFFDNEEVVINSFRGDRWGRKAGSYKVSVGVGASASLSGSGSGSVGVGVSVSASCTW